MLMTGMVLLITGIEHWTADFGTTQEARLALGRVGLALPYVAAAGIGLIFLFAAKGQPPSAMPGRARRSGRLRSLPSP